MIIPVVFTLLPLYDNLIYTWIFYKGVDLAKHYGWPVFAQQQYFTQTDKQRKYGWLTPEMAAGLIMNLILQKILPNIFTKCFRKS